MPTVIDPTRKLMRTELRYVMTLLDNYIADGLDNRWIYGQLRYHWRKYRELQSLERSQRGTLHHPKWPPRD